MTILIIEDEQDIAAFLKKGLEENGHRAQLAFDGEMGLRLAAGDFPLSTSISKTPGFSKKTTDFNVSLRTSAARRPA